MTLLVELGLLLTLALASGVLTAIEAAMMTARLSRLEQAAQGKNRRLQEAAEVIANRRRYSPAVRAAVALTSAMVYVLSSIAFVELLAARLSTVGNSWVAGHSTALAAAIVVVATSFVMFVLSDLAPRRVALAHAEKIACWFAVPTQILSRLFRPVVWFAEAATQLIVGPVPTRGSEKTNVSIEDIEHLLRTGTNEGVLDASEHMVARRALRLGDRTVREIMHPRIEIDALDVDTPPEEVIGAVAMAGFSRLPIHEGDLDNIIGFVYTKDLLLRQHMGWPIELRKLVRPALLVPQSLRIDRLLERFRQKRTQMAIVLDEFGGTEGLVTMEDVLELLVGEVHDEHRPDRERSIVRRDERTWQVDGSLPLRDWLLYLEEESPTDLPIEASTVGGLVLFVLGRIPDVGDVARWRQFTLEIDAMEGRRVERVVVRRSL